MRMRYTCNGCRPVIRSGDFNAGRYFAGIIARREYGRRGTVRLCRINSWSWSADRWFDEYEAFIGVPCADGISGHSIMFSVTTENA